MALIPSVILVGVKVMNRYVKLHKVMMELTKAINDEAKVMGCHGLKKLSLSQNVNFSTFLFGGTAASSFSDVKKTLFFSAGLGVDGGAFGLKLP